MPQQINLCTSNFLTQKRQVSADSIIRSLAVFIVLGTGLAAFWVWGLQQIDATTRQTLSSNLVEIKRLQDVTKIAKARNAPANAAMTQEIQQQRTELQQRELLLAELRRGLTRDGQSHSARLLLVAQSIPPQVWVTEIKADDQRIELSGFTLEPAALNVWMDRLARSPLLQGQQLNALKVERVVSDVRNDGSAAGLLPAALNTAKPGAPNIWSYNIVSALAGVNSPDTTGSKP